MSASQYRGQLERKRKQRVDAENRAGAYRTKESTKRAEAAKSRQAAAKTKSETTARTKLREADRREREAETAGKEAGRWQTKTAGYAKDEAALLSKLTRAEKSEADAAQRRQKREQQQADRLAAADRAALESRITGTEAVVDKVLRQLPAPKPEKLRVLIGPTAVIALMVLAFAAPALNSGAKDARRGIPRPQCVERNSRGDGPPRTCIRRPAKRA